MQAFQLCSVYVRLKTAYDYVSHWLTADFFMFVFAACLLPPFDVVKQPRVYIFMAEVKSQEPVKRGVARLGGFFSI